MKRHLLVIPDGAADLPLASLGGRTPLEAASTPNIDLLAASGEMGLAVTVPEGMTPGSDVANLSLLSYRPDETGFSRGALEAAGMGIEIGGDETAFRANLVTTDGGAIIDHSSGHITTEESATLIASLLPAAASRSFRLIPGISYRHIMLGPSECRAVTFPPHDNIGRPIGDILPRGDGEEPLRALIEESGKILAASMVNAARRERGLRTADLLWPWGGGPRVSIEPLSSRFGVKGSIISAVDLVRGIGVLAGLEPVIVEGATAFYDTDYGAKGAAAVKALEEGAEIVVVHVEAPDEAGHAGETDEKIRSIERIDALIVGPVLKRFAEGPEILRIMVAPDHPTVIEGGRHTADPVPYLIWDSRNRKPSHPSGVTPRLTERYAGSLGRPPVRGDTLLGRLLQA